MTAQNSEVAGSEWQLDRFERVLLTISFSLVLLVLLPVSGIAGLRYCRAARQTDVAEEVYSLALDAFNRNEVTQAERLFDRTIHLAHNVGFPLTRASDLVAVSFMMQSRVRVMRCAEQLRIAIKNNDTLAAADILKEARTVTEGMEGIARIQSSPSTRCPLPAGYSSARQVQLWQQTLDTAGLQALDLSLEPVTSAS